MDGSTVLLIDLQLTTRVRQQPDSLQIQLIGIASAAVGPQDDVTLDAFTRFKMGHDMRVEIFQLLVFLAVPAPDTGITQVVTERIGNLPVEKGQQSVGRIDQFHLGAKASKNGGIFTSDHTRANDGDLAWRRIEPQDGVAVKNAGVGEVDARGPVWS